ncbi:MAG: glycoside hydrolase family 88 protein [Kangiellaceae bacterium]|nr:glycoside hydrolase family 88 protein [Kangiellaceae bacterium]
MNRTKEKSITSKCLFFITVPLLTAFFTASCGETSGPASELDSFDKKAATKSTQIAQVELTNPSVFARNDQPVYISYYDLGISKNNQQAIELFVSVNSNLIPSQDIDTDYDGINDSVFFLADLEGNEPVTYVIKSASKKSKNSYKVKRTQAEISHKTGGEWISHSKKKKGDFKEYTGGEFVNVTELSPPAHYTDHSNWIRYEGPGIESDKVGYRIYLDWRNGFDIFGKNTSEPALQKVGLDGYDSYHHMQPWGMDILKVGSSLGSGGFGLWNDNKLSLVSDVGNWKATVLENGDLRSSIKINYNDWNNSLNIQDLTANISMNAGSRLANVELQFTNDIPAMATGVVKHKETELIVGELDITGKAYSYIASWGKQSLDDSMLGMAIFFKREDLLKVTQDEKNYLAILKPSGKKSQQKLNYLFAAAWEPESSISSKDKFIEYLDQETEKLTIDPRSRLKTALSQSQTVIEIKAADALSWSTKLADSELKRKALNYHYNGWDENRKRKPKFEYDIVGLQPLAYYELASLTGDKNHSEVIEKVTATFITEEGDIRKYKQKKFNIDSVAPGRNLLKLYKDTNHKKYRTAAGHLRKQLAEQPKTTQGAFWHKQKYTSQVWLDGVYMGMPFLAEYAMMFEEGQQQTDTLEQVVKEFRLARKYLKDKQTGLYYHAWDEQKKQDWADKETGRSSYFWGRGLGWFVMGLVDVLDHLPKEKSELRNELIEIANELAEGIAKVQDPTTGTWWQIMEQPASVGNYRESTASAMFVYFFAKAINNNYISSTYRKNATRGYQGLINEFVLSHQDGSISMTNQCLVAGLGFGRDGSYQYYMSEPIWKNDPKGNGPFIFSGIEMYKLLSNEASLDN